MSAPWTAAAADAIGLAWLARAIAPAGGLGRRARAERRTFAPGDEAAAREEIARVHRLSSLLSAELVARLEGLAAAAPDPSALVARARDGETLADDDLFEVSRFLLALAEIEEAAPAAARTELAPPAVLADVAAILAPGRTGERGFYLADAFDTELAAARSAAALAQAAYDAARSELARGAAEAAAIRSVRDGEFIVMKDELRGPLPASVRVVREAPTYVLCELVLDDEAHGALARLEAARNHVEAREEDVRARISAAIGAAAERVGAAARTLGEMSERLARVRFALAHDAVVPSIVAAAEISFADARFLPLAQALAERGRDYRPISLDLRGVAALTGPNMGGKSAALRTCGFLAACAAFGVPVPARSATVALFDRIDWIGIGLAQSDPEALLSAFGTEVLAVRAALESGARRHLVLVDEFARTTSPREGRALTLALVARLRAAGATALVATHFAGIGRDGGIPHFAIAGLGAPLPATSGPLDLDAALARIAAAMEYRIVRADGDDATGDDAIELAAALGLDEGFVARAREVLRAGRPTASS